ncbi:sensor histidine kinase [Streptomyces sp. NBC_01497]|uniref:sensor histidine kinase n=1 Tax=Streptomyces sp. NBC_01497 TaxID=2903885 RepID=UPI002E349222|nr:histidine kinase [Streptomyces sp. NBC_01497]
MVRFLRPLASPVTFTRWLHLAVPMAFFAVWSYIVPGLGGLWMPALALVPFGLLRWMRHAEALQAQLLLEPHERAGHAQAVSVAPAATWTDRWRTALWLQARLLMSLLFLVTFVYLPMIAVALMAGAIGGTPGDLVLMSGLSPHWWWGPCSVLFLAAAVASSVGVGSLEAYVARRLLGPSRGERVASLEARTEQLLERTRIAHELHDSIGHALTLAVVQAGAARTAGDAAFTDRALAAIEETGRVALQDLERVLLVLREAPQGVSRRPTLADADRLLDSARASGAAVEVKVSGPVEQVPGAFSREGYRILQEALTNVLRHSGPVPVRVHIDVTECSLDLRVSNPLPAVAGAAPGADRGPAGGGGGGLRGMEERAALLGGEAVAGPRDGEWRVSARLPLDGFR